MGARAKAHRKKVAARNQRIKGEIRKVEDYARKMIALGKQETDQSQYTMLSAFNPAVQSAVDVHRSENNK